MSWFCKAFQELSTGELYDILRLRNEVFVVEQTCIYQDADGLDEQAFHVGWHRGDTFLAYLRFFAPVQGGRAACFGRVVTASTERGKGLGRSLVERGIQEIDERYDGPRITISAQCYLTRFYESFGFCAHGSPYLEDGIPHISMDRAGR